MDLRQGAHRALGSLRPSRHAAEIRPVGVSDRSGGGTPRRPRPAKVGIALVSRHLSRATRCSIGCSARRACAALRSSTARRQRASARRRTPRRARHVGLRRPRNIPPDFPHFDYVDPQAPKGGVFSQIGPGTQFNQNFLTFNSLNSYILRGDAAQGMELTFATPDGARRRRARRHVRACRARGAHLRRRADLSLLHAAGGHVSTTARRSPRTTSPSR